ncbi:MAG: hypothetical protein B7Y80_07585 [Hyphomicrobium sp. 32-62-53]|nr:MAG: hypothetical protein B7Z29_03935 [Hyphomicrobium sp. 12-62-95]OYY00470.1 MAG: hypothetical protein B7Y80_07585 [Hyphomicrobium sp. 32-62-53]
MIWNGTSLAGFFRYAGHRARRYVEGHTIMDNPGIYLVAWLLIAPVIGALFLSGLGSSRTATRHDNSL